MDSSSVQKPLSSFSRQARKTPNTTITMIIAMMELAPPPVIEPSKEPTMMSKGTKPGLS